MKYQIRKSLFAWVLAAMAFTGIPQANAMIMGDLKVAGFADTAASTVIDNMDGTSTFSQVDYLFKVNATPGVAMTYLKLEFEDDVFKSVGPVVNPEPNDWSITPSISGGSLNEIATAGTPVASGGTLSFSVTNVVVFNEALRNASLWQEGHIWSQSFAAADFNNLIIDGGSTSKVSEPPSLVLLGLGLLGLGFGLRHRKLN